MYTINHIKAAFNAGKHFQTYDDWVKWSEIEIGKISTSDPAILSNKIASIGGKIRERESEHHILIDLRSITRDDAYAFLESELFAHRGYGKSDDWHKYVSPKYNKMFISYDSSYGFFEIFHQDPISKEQELRDMKIDTITNLNKLPPL